VSNDFSAELIALIAVGLLALVMRWVFRPSRPRTGRQADAAEAADARALGLLDVLVSRLDRPAALQVRARLGEADIRSSMSRRRDGTMDVLVFRADLERARALLQS
jgi:hypothetical protein